MANPVASLLSLAFGRWDEHDKNVSLLVVTSHHPSSSQHSQVNHWTDDCVTTTVDLWNLTPDERLNLEELGSRLQDINHLKNTPAELVRFMLSCPNNVHAAEERFRKSIAWRIRNNVDTIVDDYFPPQEIYSNFPGAILDRMDKEGDPVFLSRTGVTDAAGMLQRYGKQEMLQHAIWTREMIFTGKWTESYEERRGRPVRQVLIIEDLVGLPLFQIVGNGPLLSMYGEVMRLDQDNFPETAKKLVIIRAPALFRMVWNVVKHFFDPEVRNKMVFSGVHDFQEVLSEYIDLEILPECVLPGVGVGKPTAGMPPHFEGGRLPPLTSGV